MLAAERRPEGFDPALYHAMAALGWAGILLPPEFGGSGGDWSTLALVYEEAGSALALSPHFPSLVAAQAILRWGSNSLRRQLLPTVAAGERLLTWAAHEPLTRETVEARVEGDRVVLNGVNRAVLLGHVAHNLVVAAMDGPEYTLCLIEPGTGLRTTPLSVVGGLKLAAVEFEDAPGLLLAKGGATREEWAALLLRCRLMLAAEMAGGAQAALTLAVDYAKQRVAFGQPIGAFQALQHKMANMSIHIEGARVAIAYAATLLDQGKPADAPAAAAQLQATLAYRYTATEGVQVFGGLGVMEDSPISPHFRRAKALELMLGPVDNLHEQIAHALRAPEPRAVALTLLR